MKNYTLTPAIMVFLVSGLALSGCASAFHSPSLDVLGSYFPAWLVCIVCGLAVSLVLHQVFIALKLDAWLRPALLVYLCLLITCTLLIWLALFKN
ncbi:MAG: YtcA family lipoprotein [Chthoniobacteraceae bacterium]